VGYCGDSSHVLHAARDGQPNIVANTRSDDWSADDFADVLSDDAAADSDSYPDADCLTDGFADCCADC
jgi:hypothetical protein